MTWFARPGQGCGARMATATQDSDMTCRHFRMARLVSLALSPAASAAEEGSCVWSAIALANDMAIRAGRALGMPGHPPRGSESTLRKATRTDAGAV